MADPIYKTAFELLQAGKKIILARIIRRSGSTPRDVGSMCLVTEDDKLIGTVGGGLLEHKVREKALTLFENPRSYIYRFKLSNDDLAKNGMICGGDADLYLEPLFPENRHVTEFFKTLADCITENIPVRLITRIEDGIKPDDENARVLIENQGIVYGNIDGIDPKNYTADKKCTFQMDTIQPSGMQAFVESITLHPRVFLFGAGHVSSCVAPLAAKVGFDITVIDDRAEFANQTNFPDADTILVSDFKDAFGQLAFENNAYILIITRGHLHDKTVLELSLKTPATYIGMIGSMKKRNVIYRDLMNQGVSKERLEQVYSPVGLEINAETPEEIAVSIVAELIKVRNPAKEKKKLII